MEDFYEAFINCSHKALGKCLKPFCLRHCLYLEAIGSPFMRVINGEEVPVFRKDLELAVIICSADGDILKALEKANSIGNFGMRLHFFKPALTAFLGYLTDFIAVPELWDRTEGESVLNAPWILSRAMLLLSKTSMTLKDVWDMPLGELLWYCATIAEQEGVGQIQSDEEKKMIEEALKAREENDKQ